MATLNPGIRSPGGIIFLIVPTSNSEKQLSSLWNKTKGLSARFPSRSRGLRKNIYTSARTAVWCMQFFARSTPRVNNASSSSDNEHRKKYFFLPLRSGSLLLHYFWAERTFGYPSQANRRENQTHTPILQSVDRESVFAAFSY